MKKIRYLNRGIILLVLLVIGLSAYLVYDGISLQNQQEEMKKVITEYYGKVIEMNLLPEEHRTALTEVPASVIKQKTQENKQVIEKFWTTSDGLYVQMGYIRKSHVLQLQSKIFDKQQKGEAKVTDGTISNIEFTSFKKIAPHTVSVSIACDYWMEMHGVVELFCGATIQSPHIERPGMHSQYFGGKPLLAEDPNQDTTYRSGNETTIVLVKQNSDWKIAAFVSGSWSNEEFVPIEPKSQP